MQNKSMDNHNNLHKNILYRMDNSPCHPSIEFYNTFGLAKKSKQYNSCIPYERYSSCNSYKQCNSCIPYEQYNSCNLNSEYNFNKKYSSFDIYIKNKKILKSKRKNTSSHKNTDANLSMPWGIIFYNNNLYIANKSGIITEYTLMGSIAYINPIYVVNSYFAIQLPPNFINGDGDSDGDGGLGLGGGFGQVKGFGPVPVATGQPAVEPTGGHSNPQLLLTPTGIAYNNKNNYIIKTFLDKEFNRAGKHPVNKQINLPATLIIATMEGTINAYNKQLYEQAIIVIDNRNSEALYTGIALTDDYLFVANFGKTKFGYINVFDNCFNPVNLPGAFMDSSIPIGFAPINVVVIDNLIYVMYANKMTFISSSILHLATGTNYKPMPYVGNGIINIFNMDGTLNRRFTSYGKLNIPWAFIKIDNILDLSHNIFPFKKECICPSQIKYSKCCKEINDNCTTPVFIVGNYGDGHINIFNCEGIFLGQLKECDGNVLTIDSLLGMVYVPGSIPSIYAVSNKNKVSSLSLLTDC